MRSYALKLSPASVALGTLAVMDSVIGFCIAGVLAVSACAKAIAPSSRSDLAVFGAKTRSAQWAAWGVAIIVELTLAALLVLDIPGALLGATALFGGFAALQVAAIRRGGTGQACGCLGHRGTISWRAAFADALLALVSAAAFVASVTEPSERSLVIAGFVILSLAVAALAVAIAALARELGIVRLALQSGGALEIPEEGPPLGMNLEIGRWFDTAGREMALAIFTSSGCPVCRNLEPAVEFVGRDSGLAVLTFDEGVDADAWSAFEVPGAPYAVALDRDGQVLAKGVVNSLPQIESVLATAVRRRAETANA